jgi:hypothetical protein
VNFKNIDSNHSESSRLSAGQSLTDGVVFPGEVNGTIVSGNNLARLNPRIDVAPKSKIG